MSVSLWILNVLVSFPTAVIKHPDKTPQEKGSILGHIIPGTVHHGWDVRQQGHIMHQVRRREPCIHGFIKPTLFIHSRIPLAIKIIEAIPLRFSLKTISPKILDPFKQTTGTIVNGIVTF